MLTDTTLNQLRIAVANPEAHRKGKKRKTLIATYDRMLGELSQALLGEECQSRMTFRQRLNEYASIGDKREQRLVRAIRAMTKNEIMLLRKDYTDHGLDIDRFLQEFVAPVLEALNDYN